LSDEKKTDPLTLQISQSAIDEALRSVERKGAKAACAVPPRPTEPDLAEATALRDELLGARQALRQREAELELSQQMGRQTLEKLKDEHERALRALADLDNLRKRAGRERDEHARFSQEKLLRDLLPVLDNLDRALEHADTPARPEALTSGIRITRKLFEDVLGRYGVRSFSAAQQPFDPRLHEAMQSVESEKAPGTVVSEMVRGYTLHERLLRPAMVVVSRPRTEPPPAHGAAGSSPRTGGPLEERPSADRSGSSPRTRGPLEERPSADRSGSSQGPPEGDPARPPSGSKKD
jgi:molecular chaperone GrpE